MIQQMKCQEVKDNRHWRKCESVPPEEPKEKAEKTAKRLL